MYNWDDPKKLLTSLVHQYPSGTIVMGGHSNTTPKLGNLLLGTEGLSKFDETDYGDILIINASKLGNGRLLHLRF